MHEAGLDRFIANSWYGLFVLAGTSKDIVTRLNVAPVKALRSDDPAPPWRRKAPIRLAMILPSRRTYSK
ncbi:MAG: hypothetical protein GEV05_15190 [Betaproteobacteria bacterium]|nr:hypothetical protein [Betaproteobacteria bacterium]